MMLDYLREGRRVVANFPIDPAPASFNPNGNLANASVEVIPARPSMDMITSLGFGWVKEDDYWREDRSGLLVIDEAGGWIPARDWRGDERAQIIDFFNQHRKWGWDVILLSPLPENIDSQVRANVEVFGRARRTDRKKWFGIKLPRFHICIFRFGTSEKGNKLETRVYRGEVEHKCFNSYARFSAQNSDGHYCTLPPRITKWATHQPAFIRFKKRLSQVFSGELPKLPPKPKHPLVQWIERQPEHLRLDYLRRFEAIGAFNRPFNPA